MCRRLRASGPVDGQGVAHTYEADTDSNLRHIKAENLQDGGTMATDRTNGLVLSLAAPRSTAVSQTKCLGCTAMLSPMSSEGEGSPLLTPSATNTVPPTSVVASGHDLVSGVTCGPDVSGLPVVLRTGGKKSAETDVWLDKTLARIGARVPWGRRCRGRFAKVGFFVWTSTRRVQRNAKHS